MITPPRQQVLISLNLNSLNLDVVSSMIDPPITRRKRKTKHNETNKNTTNRHGDFHTLGQARKSKQNWIQHPLLLSCHVLRRGLGPPRRNATVHCSLRVWLEKLLPLFWRGSGFPRTSVLWTAFMLSVKSEPLRVLIGTNPCNGLFSVSSLDS